MLNVDRLLEKTHTPPILPNKNGKIKRQTETCRICAPESPLSDLRERSCRSSRNTPVTKTVAPKVETAPRCCPRSNRQLAPHLRGWLQTAAPRKLKLREIYALCFNPSVVSLSFGNTRSELTTVRPWWANCLETICPCSPSGSGMKAVITFPETEPSSKPFTYKHISQPLKYSAIYPLKWLAYYAAAGLQIVECYQTRFDTCMYDRDRLLKIWLGKSLNPPEVLAGLLRDFRM
jgi:hypothetical protein